MSFPSYCCVCKFYFYCCRCLVSYIVYVFILWDLLWGLLRDHFGWKMACTSNIFLNMMDVERFIFFFHSLK